MEPKKHWYFLQLHQSKWMEEVLQRWLSKSFLGSHYDEKWKKAHRNATGPELAPNKAISTCKARGQTSQTKSYKCNRKIKIPQWGGLSWTHRGNSINRAEGKVNKQTKAANNNTLSVEIQEFDKKVRQSTNPQTEKLRHSWLPKELMTTLTSSTSFCKAARQKASALVCCKAAERAML